MSQANEIPLAALLAIVAVLVQGGSLTAMVGVERRLTAKARDYAALRVRLAQPSGEPEIDDLRAAADRALEAGQLAEADRALAQAELKAFAGSTDLSEMSRERRAAAASCRAQRGATCALRISPEAYREAAQRYGEAVAIVGTSDIARRRDYALDQVDALARLGEDFDDAPGFEAAVALCRTLLAGLDNFEDTVAWGQVQERLGLALAGLGRLKTGEEHGLQAAAACYRTALEDVRPQVSLPLTLRLQGHLGRATLRLGELRNDVDLFEESADALQLALTLCKRSEDPLGWARLQSDLGDALAGLGARMSGTAKLEGALNAFRAASDVLTQKDWPTEWSQIQHASGLSLCDMAARYGEPLFLEEAISSFSAALLERPRATQPVPWAHSAASRAQTMIQLAQRRAELPLAEQALAQLMATIAVFRSAGLAAEAKRFEAALVKGAAVVEALRKA